MSIWDRLSKEARLIPADKRPLGLQWTKTNPPWRLFTPILFPLPAFRVMKPVHND